MKSSIATFALTAVVLAGFSAPIDADTEGKTRLRARVRADRTSDVRGALGSGYASNGEDRKRLAVRIRANSSAGTMLDVTACGQKVGDIKLTARGDKRSAGHLKLSTGARDDVPDCIAGNEVIVTGPGLSIVGVYQGRSRSSP